MKYLKSVSWIVLGIAILFNQPVNADQRQCGDRVPLDEVLIVNLEDYVDQQALFKEKLHKQAGDFVLITEAPMKVKVGGNPANAINWASKSAAHHGCNLLVLLGESVTETRWQGKITRTRYLMMHMGKREGP